MTSSSGPAVHRHNLHESGHDMRSGHSRHVPIRMCVICRKRLPKHEMTRYVCPGDAGRAVRDQGQNLPGRGFYLCDDEACGERFAKFKAGNGAPRGKE